MLYSYLLFCNTQYYDFTPPTVYCKLDHENLDQVFEQVSQTTIPVHARISSYFLLFVL